MSLSVNLDETLPCTVWQSGITHNLNGMAQEAGLYDVLWEPIEHGYTKAIDLVNVLQQGLVKLKSDPNKYKALNPINGWGTYDEFVVFVASYIKACEEHPSADVRVYR